MRLYNSILEHLILPTGDSLLQTKFVEQLRYWRHIQWMDDAQLASLQQEALARLLQHATDHVPYYQAQPIAGDHDPTVWLRRFPVMTKPTIKAELDRLVVGCRDRLVAESSSGSSGVQGTVYLTKHEESTTRAIQVLWWEWAGYRLGDPVFQTGITPKRGLVKTAKDVLLRTDYRSAFHLDDAGLTQAIERIGRRQGIMLLGYASSLSLLAQTARRLGRTDIRPRGIVSWGDKLFDHSRRLIEETFATPVHDTYASTEGFMIAGQCDRRRYHITTPQIYLELLDRNLEHEVPPGELGHVVVTRLDAYAMPLIRYYLGDLAIREDPRARCECGRSLPLLRQVVGRNTDIVRTRSGKYLIVHFFTGIFEHVPEIRQFRVLQQNLDAIEVEYVADRGFRPDVLRQVERRIHEYLREPFPVCFRAVDQIPASPSGKPEIVRSSVQGPP